MTKRNDVVHAIDDSATETRTVRLPWSEAAEEEVLERCDDHSDAEAEAEYWGVSDAGAWRVHLVR